MKRLLIMILVLVLTLSLLSTVWAEGDKGSGSSDSTSIVGSGSCGENLTWTLDNAGVLNISGTGEMASDSGANWIKSDIKKVCISEGVTSIGLGIFQHCTSLTSITMPNSIISIDSSAFLWCKSLTDITIPTSVISIGEAAFYGCNSLTNITIPKSVKTIGNSAFARCESLQSIQVDSENPCFSSEDGVLFSKNKDILYCYLSAKKNEFYQVPDSVTLIGDQAFDGCENLTSITIPGSVTSIGYYAFNGCENLSSITIHSGVISISSSAFDFCTSLTNIFIPDSVTSIGPSHFVGCKNIQVDPKNQYFSSEDGVLFSKNKDILYWYPGGREGTSYQIPDGVASIGDSAFSWCKNLTSITIPDSVTLIDDESFCGCENLTSITIPNGVASIGSRAFGECVSLTSIVIPDSVAIIDNSAFSWCTNLASITIPTSVTSIGTSAFAGCVALNDVYYSGSESEWNKISIGSYNEDLVSATIHFNTVPPSEKKPTIAVGTNEKQEIKVDANGTMVITVPDVVNKKAATVTFNRAAVDSISGYGDLTLTLKDNTANLSEVMKNAAEVRDKDVVSIELTLKTADGIPIFTEGVSAGEAVITIPYKTGLLSKNIKVFQVNGGSLTSQEFEYDRLTGVVTLRLAHFSEYLITSKIETAPLPPPEPTAKDTVNSANTFDLGVGIYAVSTILSITGMTWAGKKKF